jgi:hypothetical protein
LTPNHLTSSLFPSSPYRDTTVSLLHPFPPLPPSLSPLLANSGLKRESKREEREERMEKRKKGGKEKGQKKGGRKQINERKKGTSNKFHGMNAEKLNSFWYDGRNLDLPQKIPSLNRMWLFMGRARRERKE